LGIKIIIAKIDLAFDILNPIIIQMEILKTGVIKLHHQAILFFLGLILGEFIVGSVWSIIGGPTDVPIPLFRHYHSFRISFWIATTSPRHNSLPDKSEKLYFSLLICFRH